MRRSRNPLCLGALVALSCALPASAQQTQNAFSGPTGGIRVVDAGSGPKGTFRLALNSEFFIISNYLVDGDEVHRFAGNLSLTVTPTRYLEVFASAEVTSAWSNSNDPRLIQRVADVLVGLKGFYPIKPWATLGGDMSLFFPGGVGDASATFRGTSIRLDGNVSLDLREHARRDAPIILRFNAGYFFDNTANLVRGIEDQRFAALGGVVPRPLESRHLVTSFERLAYGVNRVDTVHLATGLEVPLRARNVGLHPIVEWQWDIPVNRQGYVCPSATPSSSDGCLADEGLKAFPMLLTAGLRILSPPRGLAFTVGVDIGLTGARTFVRELEPTVPYNVVLGIGYAFDPGPTCPPPTEAASVTGRVAGRIVEAGSGTPIPGAVVRVSGQGASPQVTDEAGRFTTYALAEGEARLDVSHPDYVDTQCPALVPSEVECALRPSEVDGQLEVFTVNRAGDPIGGVTVRVRGPSEHQLVSDAGGIARVAELEAGAYTAYVDDERFLIAVRPFDIVAREETEVQMRILRRPTRPRVVVRRSEIGLRRQVSFATGSDEILPNSELLLLEVADALLRNPDIVRVEVQGHTDSRGDFAVNMKLSQQRAEAVRRWLVQHGVEPDRLTAKGYGPTRPVAPNITAYNRARNRRVQFKILERAAGVGTP